MILAHALLRWFVFHRSMEAAVAVAAAAVVFIAECVLQGDPVGCCSSPVVISTCMLAYCLKVFCTQIVNILSLVVDVAIVNAGMLHGCVLRGLASLNGC